MHQKGNILFLILIAVALFAALSYAVTGSSRNSGSSIQRDKAKLIASHFLQYGAQLENAVNRLMLINGCSDKQLSFERSPFDGSDGAFYNANAPSDYRCHVFHVNGGNQKYYRDIGLTDYVFNFSVEAGRPVPQVGTDCVSAQCTDLRLSVRLNNTATSTQINENARLICEEIVKLLNDGSVGLVGDDTQYFYNGSYSYFTPFGTLLNGKRTFCGRVSNTPPIIYTFGHILLAR